MPTVSCARRTRYKRVLCHAHAAYVRKHYAHVCIPYILLLGRQQGQRVQAQVRTCCITITRCKKSKYTAGD